MTADIVEFPARPAGEPVRVRRVAAEGDIVVLCLNATVGLWAAWPVAAVDDDGVVMGVTYRATMEAKDLRGDPSESFTYGGVIWEKYPGYGDVEMDADECRFIPMGVPGLFISRYAPANWFSAVNRKGLPRYAMATLDPTGEKWIDLEGQTNGLHICTRPEVLIPGRLK